MPATWPDQPTLIVDAPIISNFRVDPPGPGSVRVEVRFLAGTFYLSTGHVHGSITYRCPNARDVLELLDKFGRVTLPNGVTVEPNAP